MRSDLSIILAPVDRLFKEIIDFIPIETKYLDFRSDLAGLLVVTMSAAYENCVKETLVNYCTRHNSMFGAFASKQYEKLNSKINAGDLIGYAKLFGLKEDYKSRLRIKREAVLQRTTKDICDSYDQILIWRHQYAHSRRQNTTVEEAFATHIFAKRVLFVFSDCFC